MQPATLPRAHTSIDFTSPLSHLGNSLNAGGPKAGRKRTQCHAIAFFSVLFLHDRFQLGVNLQPAALRRAYTQIYA